jgi:hypothetical protein
MVWIDEVQSALENEGVCTVSLTKTGMQCSSRGLRQSTLVEWLAQGAGFAQAAFLEQSAKNAYLAAVNSLEYCSENEWDEFQKELKLFEAVTITLKLRLLRKLGPITIFSGEVYAKEKCLGKASFKTFSE